MSTWEFAGDRKGTDGWQPYNPKQTEALNLAWSHKDAVCELGAGYTVNMKTMKQMNVKTKFERGVRRTDGHAAAAAAAGGGGGAAASVSAPRRNLRSVIQVEVVESFAPISDEQLSVRAGEFLTVIGDAGPEWLKVCNETGEEGEIPRLNTKQVSEASVPVPLPLLAIHKQMSAIDHTDHTLAGEMLWDRSPALLAAAEATGRHTGGIITTEDRISVLMGVKSSLFTVEEATQIVALLEGKGGSGGGDSGGGGGGDTRSQAGAKALAREVKKNRQQFLNAITVVPYGVLGMNNQNKQIAPLPDSNIMFVDPASVKMIQSPKLGPSCAGGASGAIYRFLGINRSRTFPYEVRAAVQHESDAGYKKYGKDPKSTHVIHTVGPDFKAVPKMSRKDAVAKLALTYQNIFTVAAQIGRHELRLLPVSGGIFSGKFKEEMPRMTAEAIIRGYKGLSEWLRACIRIDINVKLCAFGGDKEANAYSAALKMAVAKYS